MAIIPFLNNAFFAAKVGIGTESPGAKLDVSGDILIDSGEYLSWGTVGATSIEGSTASNKLQFRTNSSDRMIINDTGVGIGTTSPQSPLHIYRSLNGGVGGELRLDNNNGAVANKTQILFSDGGGASNSFNRAAITCETEASPYMGQLQFKTGVGAISTKLIILGNGNVGIGTTNPAGALSVENTGTAGVPVLDIINTSVSQFNHSGEVMTPNMTTGQNNIFVIGRAGSTKNSGYIGYKYSGTAGSNANILTLGHWGSDNLMNIDGLGNVGIGTITPGHPLEIANSNSTSFAYQRTGVSANKWGFHSDNNATYWLNISAGSLLFTLQNGGNVGIGDTAPATKLEVAGGIMGANARINSSQRTPMGHYTPGETIFEIDPTWDTGQLQSYFNSPNVSWSTNSIAEDAPGGYAIYINGATNVGGVYGSGFPFIPVDNDGVYYMECYIKNVGEQGHYMGSNEFSATFASTGGNPGSFGYWVMSNTNPGTSWTKVSGYIGGFDSSQVGKFELDTKYFTPQALFNYTNISGTRACYISGWKIFRIDSPGNRYFDAKVGIGMTTPVHELDVTGTGNFTGLVSGITPVAAANFVTKAYVDGTGGGSGPFLPLAGGTMITGGTGNVIFPDDFRLDIGTGQDLRIYHNATNGSNIWNTVGNLIIQNTADNQDIIFKNDNGAGGNATYFYLDGSLTNGTTTLGATRFPDNSKIFMGTGGDLVFNHDGTDSFINNLTGDLTIENAGDDLILKAADDFLAYVQGTEIAIHAVGNAGVKLRYNGLNRFQTTNTGVDVTGDITFGDSHFIGDDVDDNLLIQSSAGENIIINSLDDILFRTNGTTQLQISSTTATFAENVKISTGRLEISGGGIDQGSQLNLWSDTNGHTFLAGYDFAIYTGSNNSRTQSFIIGGSTKNATFTGTVTSPTFLGDLNGTINTVTTAVTKANATNDTTVATTAFVQNLIGTIPAGLVFQGTWNAATNTPTLTSGSGTTGHFYIVSTSGSTNLDGVTDWVTGDWAVFIEQGGTDAWEKIDNSSVLDGIGTGNTISKWAGSGTSNTLTNSLLTDTGKLNYTTSSSALTTLKGTSAAGYAELDIANDSDHRIVIGSIGSTYPSADWAGSTYLYNTGTSKKMYIKSISDMQFFTGGYTVASNIRMTILGTNGDVGIGTTSPQTKLAIGSSQGSGIDFLYDATNNYKHQIKNYWNSSADSRMDFNIGRTSGVTPVTVMSVGYNNNVGIGTTSPGAKLVVKDSQDATFNKGIAFERSNTTQSGYLNMVGGAMNIVSYDNLPIKFRTGSNATNTPMTIEAGGNVGVGIISPNAKLEVQGPNITSGTPVDLKKFNAITTSLATSAYYGGFAQFWVGRYANTSNHSKTSLVISLNDGLYSSSTSNADTDVMTLLASGDVGIGTTSPQSKLQVDGGIQMADDTDTASADKVGTQRYRTGTEYVEVDGVELVTNGDFATDTDWNKGTGWAIGSGVASCSGVQTGFSAITQNIGTSANNKYYRVKFTVSNYSAGIVRPWIGGNNVGTDVSADGDYVQIIQAASASTNGTFYIEGSSTWIASVDNVSVIEVTAEDASYADMCMQTGSSTYEWVNIVRNTY